MAQPNYCNNIPYVWLSGEIILMPFEGTDEKLLQDAKETLLLKANVKIQWQKK